MADWQLHAHDESNAFRFCPRCGGALERRLLKANEPERLVCGRCSFVFYLDPKIAVGTIITTARDRLVLVRRAIDPGYGDRPWVAPWVGPWVGPRVGRLLYSARPAPGLSI